MLTTFLSGRVDENDNAFLMDVPGPLGPLMGVRVDEWDARGPEVVNPVRLGDGADQVDVDARLLFELVIPQGAEVIGTYQADFYAGTPAVTRNAFGAGARLVRRRRAGPDRRVLGRAAGAGPARPARAVRGRARPGNRRPGRAGRVRGCCSCSTTAPSRSR